MRGGGGHAALPTAHAPWRESAVLLARRMVMLPIRVYAATVSPALPRRCKYEPTCSRYALQAIERYGILRGIVLACWRLLRCNPFSHGGFDPVDAQRLFASRPAGDRSSNPARHRERPAGDDTR